MCARPRSLLAVPAMALLLALGLAFGLAVPVGAQSIEQAREQRRAIQARLDDAAEQLAEVEARIGTLTDEADQLAARQDELQAEADAAAEQLGTRVRDLYKRGVDTPILQMLTGEDAAGALERAELADQLLAGDRVVIERALAARTALTEVTDALADRRARLDEAREEMQATLAGLQDDLEQARALEERLVEEERERQEAARRRAEAAAAARAAAEQEAARQAPEQQPDPDEDEPEPRPQPDPPPSGGGLACPVGNPHSFTDTWGAPRGGGRRHEGVDILANYGTPVYAIVSGVWDIYSYGASAGNWAILRGDNGHTYWYMHLQEHVVGDGARVGAGTQTGTVGDTGNATGTPHLHFEYHPGGGGPVNPYPLAREAC